MSLVLMLNAYIHGKPELGMFIVGDKLVSYVYSGGHAS